MIHDFKSKLPIEDSGIQILDETCPSKPHLPLNPGCGRWATPRLEWKQQASMDLTPRQWFNLRNQKGCKYVSAPRGNAHQIVIVLQRLFGIKNKQKCNEAR